MSSQTNKISLRRVLQYLIMFLIAVVLIYYSFKGIDWREFLQNLKECKWHWIGLSMIVGGAEFLIRAIRWRLLLKSINPNTTIINPYRGITIGNLSNFAIPRIGEIVRCTIVSTSERVSFEGAIGSVIAERAWDLLCLIFLTLFMFLWQNSFGNFIKQQIIAPQNNGNAAFLGLSLMWWAIIFMILIAICAVIIALSAKRQNKLWIKIKGFFSRFKEGLLSVFNIKHKWLFFILTIALWASFWLTSYFTILAFSELSSLTWADALFLMIVGGLGWAVPVQAGIGAYHFIVSGALMQVYSLSQSRSLAFATISHSSQAVVMIVLGIVSLIFYTIEKRRNATRFLEK